MVGLSSVGHHTAPGNRYGDLNQDFALVQHAFNKDELSGTSIWQQCCVAAVLDGHGMLGEQVARQAGRALVDDVCARAKANGCNLLEQPRDKLATYVTGAFGRAHQTSLCVYDDPPDAITYPCGTMNKMTYTLYRPNGLPCYRASVPRAGGCDRLLECGTTCTLALIQGDQLCVANVGDSAAALVSLTDDGDVAARMLTVDHNGMDRQEAARILGQYGHVASISDDRGYLSIRAGMWAGYELSVTRALGHKHLSEYGVLCEPTVNTMQLQPADACLIVASDGVWDVMDPREAANRVMDVISAGGSAEEAARQLVQDTIMLAECSPGGDTDNTTALVAVFE